MYLKQSNQWSETFELKILILASKRKQRSVKQITYNL